MSRAMAVFIPEFDKSAPFLVDKQQPRCSCASFLPVLHFFLGASSHAHASGTGTGTGSSNSRMRRAGSCG
jgi:hypothetical protein